MEGRLAVFEGIEAEARGAFHQRTPAQPATAEITIKAAIPSQVGKVDDGDETVDLGFDIGPPTPLSSDPPETIPLWLDLIGRGLSSRCWPGFFPRGACPHFRGRPNGPARCLSPFPRPTEWTREVPVPISEADRVDPRGACPHFRGRPSDSGQDQGDRHFAALGSQSP
jgi:hypothetical protein